MRDPKAFLKMLQLELGSRPPGGPVVKVRLALEPVRPRTEQHGLFIPLSPEPEKLELTLARIRRLVGPDNAGTPEMLDTHRPDSSRMVALGQGPAECSRAPHPHGNAPLPASTVLPKCDCEPDVRYTPRVCRMGGAVLILRGTLATRRRMVEPDLWAHDEWDVALGDGGLFRLHRELSNRTAGFSKGATTDGRQMSAN